MRIQPLAVVIAAVVRAAGSGVAGDANARAAAARRAARAHTEHKVSVFIAFLEDLFGARPRDRRDDQGTPISPTAQVAARARLRRR